MKKLFIALLLLSSSLLFAKEKSVPFSGQIIDAYCSDVCVVFIENTATGKIMALVADAQDFADVAEIHSAIDNRLAVHLETKALKRLSKEEVESLPNPEESIPYYHYDGSLSELL